VLAKAALDLISFENLSKPLIGSISNHIQLVPITNKLQQRQLFLRKVEKMARLDGENTTF